MLQRPHAVPADTASVPIQLSLPARRRLNALRLAAQRLAASDLTSPAQVVRWMLAMQGQDFPGALWSVALRLGADGADGEDGEADRPATESTVLAALARGEIVRSWPMRGTLHLAAAEDLAWMLELTGARSLAGAAARREILGLTEPEVERAREISLDVLAGGRVLGREDLLEAIDGRGVSTAGQRAYHILWYLSQTGTLVFGPPDGRRQTFVLLDAWCPRTRRMERDEAVAELAARYFASHGPATVADLARWSGLTVTELRRGMAMAGDAIATLELERVTYHLAPATLDAVAPASSTPTPSDNGRAPHVALLAGFDEYLLGYADRSAALAPEHAQAIVPGGNGMFKPTVVVDGVVAGTWSRRLTAGRVTVEVQPFTALAPSVMPGLARATEAYGAFLERSARFAVALSSDRGRPVHPPRS